jgi:dienelactone hydrolase
VQVSTHHSSSLEGNIIFFTESDFTFPAEFRRRAEDILIETKAKYHIQVFSGVKHGFAVRGDLENPDGRSYPRSSLSRRVQLTSVWLSRMGQGGVRPRNHWLVYAFLRVSIGNIQS